MDPLLQLPFGFHFDDFIVKQRKARILSGSSAVHKLILDIFEQLKVKNEFELALLHKHALSASSKDNFLEKARKKVLQKFLKEFGRLGKSRRMLKKL